MHKKVGQNIIIRKSADHTLTLMTATHSWPTVFFQECWPLIPRAMGIRLDMWTQKRVMHVPNQSHMCSAGPHVTDHDISNSLCSNKFWRKKLFNQQITNQRNLQHFSKWFLFLPIWCPGDNHCKYWLETKIFYFGFLLTVLFALFTWCKIQIPN